HAGGVSPHFAARKICGRVVEQEEIDAAVLVVIQEDGVCGEAGVSDTVFRGGFREGSIAVVDEQLVRALFRLGALAAGHGDVDVEVPVAVYVGHRSSGRPRARLDAGSLGDVVEPHVPFVQVQAARDHVAGEKDVRQAVVIDVPHGDAGAIVDVDVVLDVYRV